MAPPLHCLCDEGDGHDNALMLNLLFLNGYWQVYC
jgi:hypothetical protein